MPRHLHIVRPQSPREILDSEVADLGDWLTRGDTRATALRNDLRDLLRDVVEYAHVLTIGIVIGCLGTVGLAFIWARVAF